MLNLLRWLYLVPLVLLGVGFALANRHLVTVDFDPFNEDVPTVAALSIPLYVVVFLSIIIGVLLGGIASWINHGRHRRAFRAAKSEAQQLRGELETASARQGSDKQVALFRS